MIKTNKNSNPIAEDRVSVIEINGFLFGVDILKSKEVFPLPSFTAVPNSKEFVLGVFNLRGEIYPLVDISLVLGLEPKPVQASDMVMLLEGDRAGVGIITDRIHGVHLIHNTSIKSPKGSIPTQMQEYIEGMVSDRSTEIYLLNLERLISALTSSTFN
jgi:purine-binding chemotaxis protein CheW